MAIRIIAVVIIAVLGVLVWQKKAAVEKSAQPPLITAPGSDPEAEPGVDRVDKRPKFFNPDVEGVDPGVPPELNVDVEMRMVGPRQVLFFTVTEAHGWYVDHIFIEFWYVRIDDDGEEHRVDDPADYMCHNYLDFGATLVEDTTLLRVEFIDLFDQDDPESEGFGTTENWRVRVRKWGKVLAPKP